jgi:Raf kinase inhibitor-like YbhB/YbcL family protein
MLEHVPAWLGHALKGMRAGSDKLCIAQLGVDFGAMRLSSPAFADGAPIPARFTADGEGVSPPLLWERVPDGTGSFALIVEDPDAPAPQPLVHAVVWNIPGDERALPEGAIGEEGPRETGRNSYFMTGWLPPDPPTGHGPHRYSFQLFALPARLDLDGRPGRAKLVEAFKGRVLAAGLLTGTYSRGEPAMIGQAATAPVRTVRG